MNKPQVRELFDDSTNKIFIPYNKKGNTTIILGLIMLIATLSWVIFKFLLRPL